MFEFDDLELNEKFKKNNEDLIEKASRLSYLDWHESLKKK